MEQRFAFDLSRGRVDVSTSSNHMFADVLHFIAEMHPTTSVDEIVLITLLNFDLRPLLTAKRLYSIETMKLTLTSLSLVLSLATALVIPQHGIKSSTVVLHSKVNSMWAFDVYGREDGQLPSQEIMYAEGDPWYFNPRSGLGQSDFYPRVGFFDNE